MSSGLRPTSQRPVLLYEDQLGRDAINFGPHELVLQCVRDILELQPWELKDVDGVPKKGNSNVLVTCKKTLGKLTATGRDVIAVYDADKVRALVGLPSTACRQNTKSKLREGCTPADKLIIVFLERNTESLVEAVVQCMPELAGEKDIDLALERKDPGARDRILNRAAHASPELIETRRRLMERLPSLAYLVEKVVNALRAPQRQQG